MSTLNLCTGWTLSFTLPGETDRRTIPAQVPGNVELDLQRAGLVGDCMPADDEHAHTWLEQVDQWTYCCRFHAAPAQPGWKQELVFEGIDTIGEISLNGQPLREVRDMFMTHRIDVTGALQAGENLLQVTIRSAMLEARKHPFDIFGAARGTTNYGGQPYLRKARHEWGWDNAPRLLTSGIYRPVRLECLPPERFAEIYLATAGVDDRQVKLSLFWDYLTPCPDIRGYRLRVTLSHKGQVFHQQEDPVDFIRGKLQITLPRDRVPLWWPAGFGEPALCDVTFEMLHHGKEAARWESKWGIRTLELRRTEDITDDGQGEFGFWVNGERIYINGTNWKPLDAFHSRADGKVEQALRLVKDLHCNMVRIWGGGIYEGDAFFDYCDRNGIMVWQDFMFGCEFPPMDDWYCRQVEAETDQIVRKLRNHPSLAVWCGDNEDDSCTGWNLGGSTVRPSDNRITRQVLPGCVLRHDPFRSYVPSSPYLSDAAYLGHYPDGSPCHSTEIHLYPPTRDFSRSLRQCKSRFIGETGPIVVNAMTANPHIFAREESRARRLWDAELAPEKRNLRAHQADDYFMSWRQTGRELCLEWFGRDFGWEEWRDYSIAINIICGGVFKDVIEYCRTQRWNKTGVIWWSLLDMWPMLFNYSVVDSDFCKKMPYYWIRQSQQPFAIMVVREQEGGEAALYAANDTLIAHEGNYQVMEILPDGTQRLAAYGRYSEGPNSARMLQRMPEAGGSALWLIRWQEGGQEFANHFVVGEKSCGFDCWKQWALQLMELYRLPGEE